jgi:hypothetical protein
MGEEWACAPPPAQQWLVAGRRRSPRAMRASNGHRATCGKGDESNWQRLIGLIPFSPFLHRDGGISPRFSGGP